MPSSATMSILLSTLTLVLAFDQTLACGCGYEYAGGECSGGPQPGATRLANYLRHHFGGRTEIYNCRNIRGSNRVSLHAEGRAVDFYGGANAMSNAADHMVGIACDNGIQEVIHARRIWTSGRGWRRYNGAHPHNDHVHVGLNWCGAKYFD